MRFWTYIPRSIGIYRRKYSSEYTEGPVPRNIPRNRSSEYSEGNVPRYIPREQFLGAQRPPVVAPRGRSRLRERPGGVAARRRSGSLFASDLAESLRSRRSG
ncbi:hypothetical protein F2Q68_00011860 [Brassica cretica]|uniref:Uncharacterized protein n=1 Tax=Brassica cretica TaxID=69181 RepID=A0A8S9KX93_BRACR|nr:hypothetical protein F2Q68_00011860 [Brassica cretica]